MLDDDENLGHKRKLQPHEDQEPSHKRPKPNPTPSNNEKKKAFRLDDLPKDKDNESSSSSSDEDDEKPDEKRKPQADMEMESEDDEDEDDEKRHIAPLVLRAPQQQQQQQLAPITREQWLSEYNQRVKLRDEIEFGFVGQRFDVTQEPPEHLVRYFRRKLSSQPAQNGGRMVEYSEESLLTILHNWTQVTQTAREEDTLFFARRLFAGDNQTALQGRHVDFRNALESLKQQMQNKQMLDVSSVHGPQRIRQLDAIQKNLDNLWHYKLLIFDILARTKHHVHPHVATLCSLNSSLEVDRANGDDAKANWDEFPQLLRTVLDRAKARGLVRINNLVHEPIYAAGGQVTRCYRLFGKTGSIEEFVYSLIANAEEDPVLWGQMYKRSGNPGAIIFDLKKNKDTRFPVKEESRFVSGWRNGLYDIDKNRFYPYESLAFKHLPDSLIGCMFTDQVFDNAAYEYTIQRKGWQGLETPELDAIPKVQRWDPDQALWWYAGVARMLYPSNYKESWERMWFHMGKAGTGKTTTLAFSMEFVPVHRIGLINNTVEKVFTLQGLVDRWQWFVIDVGANWGIDQKLWNIMVEGGYMDIFIKKEDPKRVMWDKHGAACANDWIPWPDLNGEFMRRMLPLHYREFPTGVAIPKLAREMSAKNKAISLKKVNVAYHTLIEKFGSKVLTNDMLPVKIQANLREMGKHTNPLLAFLDGPTVVCKANYWMDIGVFRKAFLEYTTYCKIRGSKNIPQFDSFAFSGILQLKKCQREGNPQNLPWTPGVSKGDRPKQGEWIVGCCLKEQEQFHPNCPPDVQAAAVAAAALENGILPALGSRPNPNSLPKYNYAFVKSGRSGPNQGAENGAPGGAPGGGWKASHKQSVH